MPRTLLSAFNSRCKSLTKENLDGSPLHMCNRSKSHICELFAIMVNVLLDVTEELDLVAVVASSSLLSKRELLLLTLRCLTNLGDVPLNYG